jgi:GTP cyclohydrolase II
MSDSGVRLDTIDEALAALGRGEIIIVVDDENRENEGDFIMAAEKVTPEAINFIAKYGRGLLCLAATRERIEELDIQPMVAKNTAPLGTSFTVSIDAAEGITTGISAPDRPTLVRVHSECMTGDLFHSLRCDCGEQMEAALKAIEQHGTGVFLYMRQEGRGIGLVNKLRAYGLQDEGCDTVEANRRLGFPADLREYGIGAQILTDLGVRQMELMTNNPRKIVGVESYGLEVRGRVPLEIRPNVRNLRYLKAKKDKLGHLLQHLE